MLRDVNNWPSGTNREILMCDICQLPLCKYSHHGHQVTNIMSLNAELRRNVHDRFLRDCKGQFQATIKGQVMFSSCGPNVSNCVFSPALYSSQVRRLERQWWIKCHQEDPEWGEDAKTQCKIEGMSFCSSWESSILRTYLSISTNFHQLCAFACLKFSL